jgi:hypothetical protein
MIRRVIRLEKRTIIEADELQRYLLKTKQRVIDHLSKGHPARLGPQSQEQLEIDLRLEFDPLHLHNMKLGKRLVLIEGRATRVPHLSHNAKQAIVAIEKMINKLERTL